jgi:outer membrane protein assembly factor BamB
VSRRPLLAAAGLVILLVLTVFVAIRTLQPAETVSLAKTGYDTIQPGAPTYGKQGAVVDMPIVVDDRLRVYAHRREVWADTPVTWRWPSNPYWALHRYPGEVLGVVSAPGPLVVSKWSDGALVGTDATTGRTVWQVRTPVAGSDSSYAGRRTGSATVITPPDLYTVVVDGKTFVLSTGDSAVDAYDPSTGKTLWSHPLSGDLACREDFTTPGRFVSENRCSSTVDVVDAGTGKPAAVAVPTGAMPVGCLVGRSRCTGIVSPSGAYVIDGSGPRPAPPLADKGAVLAQGGDLVITRDSQGRLTGLDPTTGTPRWATDDVPGTVLTTDEIYAYVLRGEDVALVNLSTGEREHLLPGRAPDQDHWLPGASYASGGTLFVERLKLTGEPDEPDAEYYYQAPSVELFGSAGGG